MTFGDKFGVMATLRVYFYVRLKEPRVTLCVSVCNYVLTIPDPEWCSPVSALPPGCWYWSPAEGVSAQYDHCRPRQRPNLTDTLVQSSAANPAGK